MTENRIFTAGTNQLAPLPGYNRLPLHLWNPFETAFGYSDHTHFSERTKALCIHGAFVGLFPVTFANTLRYHLTDNRMAFDRSKMMFLLSSFKYTAMGAITAASYSCGVRLASELRDHKDDWVNHYIGGYFFMLPTAIYRGALRPLVVGGVYMSVLTALLKYLYTDRIRLFQYDFSNDTGQITNCRYPEAYLTSLQASLPKREEREKAIAFQRKDF